MSLTIRRARPSEAGLVLSFIRELAEYEKLSHEVEATEALIADALFDDRPQLYCAIAEWNAEPVGFAVWFANFSTFSGRHGVYLEDLYVAEMARGHGLGRALIDDLIALARAKGWSRLYWHTDEANRRARALYDSYIRSDGHIRYRLAL